MSRRPPRGATSWWRRQGRLLPWVVTAALLAACSGPGVDAPAPSRTPVAAGKLLLKRGAVLGSYQKSEIDVQELTRQMAGGAELDALQHELRRVVAS